MMEDRPLLASLTANPVYNKDTQFVNTVYYSVADSTGYWWVGIWIYSIQGTDFQCVSNEPVCVRGHRTTKRVQIQWPGR